MLFCSVIIFFWLWCSLSTSLWICTGLSLWSVRAVLNFSVVLSWKCGRVFESFWEMLFSLIDHVLVNCDIVSVRKDHFLIHVVHSVSCLILSWIWSLVWLSFGHKFFLLLAFSIKMFMRQRKSSEERLWTRYLTLYWLINCMKVFAKQRSE